MIRNFIYLDEYKMYSLSSQIFEGVTEYLVNEQSSSKEKTHSQQGPIASGRLLADILRSTNLISEKKYLHDYSYSLFEERLVQQEKVLVLDEEKSLISNELLQKHSFIRVKSKALFNDIKAIKNIIENFNDIGQSLALVSNFDEFTRLKNNNTHKPDKASKAKGFGEPQKSTNIYQDFAKSKNLYQDPDFLSSLKVVLDRGFHDQLEMRLKIAEFIFSADLNRNHLRESEEGLIRKYSRRTEKEFIVFGIVTQSNPQVSPTEKMDNDSESMKVAVLNIANQMTDFELSFTKKLDNEIVIEPIAVYTEL